MYLLDPPVTSNEKPEIVRWEHVAAQDPRLSPHLLEVGDDLGLPDGFRVPASNYLSREQHEREWAHLWSTVWQMACRENEVPKVGDYIVYEIVGRSILVVRDSEDSIRAFRNTCRHRGATVAQNRGNTSCFSCPFHGWTYGLDGSLQHVPARWEFPQIDGEGLRPVRCETYNGNVFINLDPDATPLIDHIGPVMARHFDAWPDHRMWKAAHFGIIVESNWKIMAEAFFEAYHIPWTHPAYAAGAGDLQGRVDVFGYHHRFISMALIASVTAGWESTEQELIDIALQAAKGFVQIPDGDDPDAPPAITLPEGETARSFMAETVRQNWHSQGLDLSMVSDAEIVDFFSNLIFPNFVSAVGPGGHITYRFRPNGDDHTSMIFEVANLVPIPGDGPLPRDVAMTMIPRGMLMRDFPAAVEALGTTADLLDEDVSNSARVQTGLKLADEIVLGQTIENSVVAFHRNIERWMKAHGG
jgi:phenylpropionate dioxygenase-like ring-hydroxylating dioxygenase large terminal subunit